MGNRGQTYTCCILDKYLTCFGLHFGLHVNNNDGDKTVTHIHSVCVYPIFLQCCTGDEACKGPICQALDECQSITFDKSLKQCKLNSLTWPVSGLNTDANFIYAERTNIPIVSIISFSVYLHIK